MAMSQPKEKQEQQPAPAPAWGWVVAAVVAVVLATFVIPPIVLQSLHTPDANGMLPTSTTAMSSFGVWLIQTLWTFAAVTVVMAIVTKRGRATALAMAKAVWFFRRKAKDQSAKERKEPTMSSDDPEAAAEPEATEAEAAEPEAEPAATQEEAKEPKTEEERIEALRVAAQAKAFAAAQAKAKVMEAATKEQAAAKAEAKKKEAAEAAKAAKLKVAKAWVVGAVMMFGFWLCWYVGHQLQINAPRANLAPTQGDLVIIWGIIAMLYAAALWLVHSTAERSLPLAQSMFAGNTLFGGLLAYGTVLLIHMLFMRAGWASYTAYFRLPEGTEEWELWYLLKGLGLYYGGGLMILFASRLIGEVGKKIK
jgi:hypothetical protein